MKMPKADFERLVLEIAQAEHPEWHSRLQAGRLEIDTPGDNLSAGDASISLSSMHARAPHGGDLRGWISQRLASNSQILSEAAYGDWATERANLRPLLKPGAWLLARTQRQHNYDPAAVPACVFPWEGPLCIACVIDRPITMVHICQEHLDNWQVTAEQVFEQARANLAHEPPLMIQVHRLAGFTVAHVEQSAYTAAYASLPGFRQCLAELLGPRFRICLITENLLAAYTPNGAPFNRDHEQELAQDLIEMTKAHGDPSKPLPFTGHIAVDIDAGTVGWRPHQPTPEQDQEAERLLQSIWRTPLHPTARSRTQPRTRRNYTQ